MFYLLSPRGWAKIVQLRKEIDGKTYVFYEVHTSHGLEKRYDLFWPNLALHLTREHGHPVYLMSKAEAQRFLDTYFPESEVKLV